ncbi:MAG: hydrogenase small subunit [bacterium]|nr:hydrogenase small subunit [bacterium]
MSGINRREFLKRAGLTAAAFAFPAMILEGCKEEVKKALAAKPVIWLQGQSCSGCSVSLLNSIEPGIPELISSHISLNFHQTLSGGTGATLVKVLEEAVDKKRKDFLLVVEGSVPTAHDLYCTLGVVKGHHVGIREWIEKLGKNAGAVLAVGSCAAFGGIPAARGNETGAKPVSAVLPKAKLINIPGCPTHPDWVTGTILHYLLKGMPELDEYKRPKLFFEKTVHEACEHLKEYEKGIFAQYWGDRGCLYMLGCLGMDSNCDIPTRKWLEVNTCTGSGSGCIGCTEDVFPDTGDRGLYMHKYAQTEPGRGTGESGA